MRWRRAFLGFVALSLLAVDGFAQTAGQLPLVIGSGSGGSSYSVPIQTLLFFTALSFIPAILLMMTGFTRIVIVLSLLRQALGGGGMASLKADPLAKAFAQMLLDMPVRVPATIAREVAALHKAA